MSLFNSVFEPETSITSNLHIIGILWRRIIRWPRDSPQNSSVESVSMPWRYHGVDDRLYTVQVVSGYKGWRTMTLPPRTYIIYLMTSWNGNISALLAICAGNSPVPGEFPAQMPVTRSFDVFFNLRLNKRLRKQWWGWWFETYRAHYDVIVISTVTFVKRTIIFPYINIF